MLESVLTAARQADILVMAAAVADFRPQAAASHKIKKEAGVDKLTVEMVRNPDILAEVAAQKSAGQGRVSRWVLPPKPRICLKMPGIN